MALSPFGGERSEFRRSVGFEIEMDPILAVKTGGGLTDKAGRFGGPGDVGDRVITAGAVNRRAPSVARARDVWLWEGRDPVSHRSGAKLAPPRTSLLYSGRVISVAAYRPFAY